MIDDKLSAVQMLSATSRVDCGGVNILFSLGISPAAGSAFFSVSVIFSSDSMQSSEQLFPGHRLCMINSCDGFAIFLSDQSTAPPLYFQANHDFCTNTKDAML